MKTLILTLITTLLAGCSPAYAGMNYFEALSMIESGGDDGALGAAGEVSRFQILPSQWQAATSQMRPDVSWNPADPVHATSVAFHIWILREHLFFLSHHRSPTDFEMYLLWSCPSRVDHPSKFKAEVATRFANLCARSPNVGQAEQLPATDTVRKP